MRRLPTLPTAALLTAALAWPLAARAGDASFSDEAAFAAAAGPMRVESFEALAASARGLAPVVAPWFTASSVDAPIGVQDGPDSPQPGYGAQATQGSHYLSVYLPNLPQGTLRFDLATPATAFAFDLVDVGETAGTVHLRTDAGAYAAGLTLATLAGDLADNGRVRFFGITQTTPFSSVFLTVDGIDEAYGVDRVQLSAVPEPAQALLWLGGLAALAMRHRRG